MSKRKKGLQSGGKYSSSKRQGIQKKKKTQQKQGKGKKRWHAGKRKKTNGGTPIPSIKGERGDTRKKTGMNRETEGGIEKGVKFFLERGREGGELFTRGSLCPQRRVPGILKENAKNGQGREEALEEEMLGPLRYTGMCPLEG